MFPKTDKIPWICFRERAGTKNTDMTFIHSTRPTSRTANKGLQRLKTRDSCHGAIRLLRLNPGFNYLLELIEGRVIEAFGQGCGHAVIEHICRVYTFAF
jgi:hypothetical protein